MGQNLNPTSLLAGLRAERRQLVEGGALRPPEPGLQRAIEDLIHDIRAGGRDGFRALLEGCLTTNNPRGAAAAFIDRLMPPRSTNTEGLIESDGEHLGYYRTPPLQTLEVSNALRLSRGDTLVDVGGGNGTTSAIFALLNPQASIVCLEFQEGLAQQALALKERFHIGNLEIVNEDAFKANLSSASVLYMYYPFSDRLFSKFIERFDPQELPDFVLNGNNPELLSRKFDSLNEIPTPFTNPDISWWRGNIRK